PVYSKKVKVRSCSQKALTIMSQCVASAEGAKNAKEDDVMMAKHPSTAQISRASSRGKIPAPWFVSDEGAVEDAEFETILPVSPRPKLLSSVISQKPLASRKFLSETRPASDWPGFGYWVFVA